MIKKKLMYGMELEKQFEVIDEALRKSKSQRELRLRSKHDENCRVP